MAKIHGMMDMGKRSMANSQTALQTVGHNIANRTTEGYSRQRVEIQADEPIGLGKLRIGQGAKTSAITRVNNPYLEKQIAKEKSSQGYFGGLSDAMGRVEQVYNEQMNKGLNTYISDFFNSYREFSNNPENLATRTQVRESADALAKDFNRVHQQLTAVQGDLDQQITTHVDEINDMTDEIAKLNEKIQFLTATGSPGNDERDRRDLLLKKLGEKINIRWGEGNDGSVTITAGQSALLVVGNESKKLHVLSTPADGQKSEGGVDVYIKNTENAEPMKITRQLTGGAVGGCLEIRDGMIEELKDDANQMAYQLAKSVNDLHMQGFDQYGRKAGRFFDIPADATNAAALIGVDDLVVSDPNRIAAGLMPKAPGDNRIASQIARLQYEGSLNDGNNTFDEFYNSMVGKVGVQTKRAATGVENQKNIVTQLTNIRESISGVSLDEEATKMIEFQKAFDASARLIRTADEMFDTVLSLKRL